MEFYDDSGGGGGRVPGKQLHMQLTGGKALFPSLAGNDTGAVIVLVTFSLDSRDVVHARLDIQKQMFIDAIPETLDPRETARAISRVIRAEASSVGDHHARLTSGER